MITALRDDFETDLGTIRTWIETDSTYTKEQDKLSCATNGYNIYLSAFDLKQIWTGDTMECATTRGWRWFIDKTNDHKEQLIIFCKLINPMADTEFGANPGECLDAIEIESRSYHLHIGTEDGEMMQNRAEINNWMPERFKNEIGLGKSFTEYIDFGFKIVIPDLNEKERIYFHFIIATNPIKASTDYPDERDVSTWLAVDQSKKWLDEKLEKYGR